MYLTDEQLQQELNEKVQQHNKAVEIQESCKKRITEILAIQKDRVDQKEALEKKVVDPKVEVQKK